MTALRFVAVAALLAGATGCLAVDPADGLLACNPSGKACPDGYVCDGSNNRCVRVGHVGSGGGDAGLDLAVDTDGGTGSSPNGTACGGDTECVSGFCVDGVCCDRACDGQCEACATSGSVGTCTVIKGQPSPPRVACNGTGACAGTCDGSNKSCTYPSSSTICGASCDGTCDGAGTCSSTGGTCPNGYACGTSGCKTSCATNNDCQPFFTCSASTCVRIAESDCLDGIDNNGDGLADCADPTCNAAVECVPSAPPGGELGLHITSGSCPAGYMTAEAYHTGLMSKQCSGCSCTTGWQATITYYSDANCASFVGQVRSTAPPYNQSICTNISPAGVGSTQFTAASANGCTAGGTATQGAPTWSTNDTFCVAKTSATCDGTHSCVAKPASAPVCARVDSASSCPTGYTTSNTVLYTDYQAGSCGACSTCTPGTNAPSLIVGDAWDTANCAGLAKVVTYGGGCYSAGGTRASISMDFSPITTDNCSATASTNPATPTGATRVCCQ